MKLSALANKMCYRIPLYAVHSLLQVGWLSGPADMIKAVAKAHQFITFTVPSSLQVSWRNSVCSC